MWGSPATYAEKVEKGEKRCCSITRAHRIRQLRPVYLSRLLTVLLTCLANIRSRHVGGYLYAHVACDVVYHPFRRKMLQSLSRRERGLPRVYLVSTRTASLGIRHSQGSPIRFRLSTNCKLPSFEVSSFVFGDILEAPSYFGGVVYVVCMYAEHDSLPTHHQLESTEQRGVHPEQPSRLGRGRYEVCTQSPPGGLATAVEREKFCDPTNHTAFSGDDKTHPKAPSRCRVACAL